MPMSTKTSGATGNKKSLGRATLLAGALGAAVLGTELARAEESGGMFIRVDNDILAGTDRGYTSGFQVGFASATVARFDDPLLPASLRSIDRKLAWLQPRGFAENNVTFAFGQAMFTPSDWSRTEPDPLDRPYAGILLASITFNGRDSRSMRSTTLDIGIVGPAALAEQTQNFVHRLLGSNQFRGWDHQLSNEPAFRVLHQRFERWDLSSTRGVADLTVHYGGSIGNTLTFANAGAELRIGKNLPDNFGTAPTLPYGENMGPTHWTGSPRRPSIHGYLAVDARAVLHNITLDGNTWRDSASVDREPFVGELAVGVALYWRGWQTTLARNYRTKEYATETRDAKFGSLTFRRGIAWP